MPDTDTAPEHLEVLSHVGASRLVGYACSSLTSVLAQPFLAEVRRAGPALPGSPIAGQRSESRQARRTDCGELEALGRVS